MFGGSLMASSTDKICFAKPSATQFFSLGIHTKKDHLKRTSQRKNITNYTIQFRVLELRVQYLHQCRRVRRTPDGNG